MRRVTRQEREDEEYSAQVEDEYAQLNYAQCDYCLCTHKIEDFSIFNAHERMCDGCGKEEADESQEEREPIVTEGN